jgi:hypothetical protein
MLSETRSIKNSMRRTISCPNGNKVAPSSSSGSLLRRPGAPKRSASCLASTRSIPARSAKGAQFTALAFTSRLEAAGIRISMHRRGRALDNVFVERLWRSVKYEHVYLCEYALVPELEKGLREYSAFYNQERLHRKRAPTSTTEESFGIGTQGASDCQQRFGGQRNALIPDRACRPAQMSWVWWS